MDQASEVRKPRNYPKTHHSPRPGARKARSEGLRDAGVLSGVRAMVARVYGGEEWHVNDDGYVGERSAGMKGRGHVYTLLDL